MTRLWSRVLPLLAVASTLHAPVVAHGGIFRAPPPPGFPTAGAPQLPGTPGGSVVADPNTPGQSLAATTDLYGWQLWWALNRDPFLNLKAAVQGVEPITGDDALYLGMGQKRGARNYRPTRSVIRGQVVPALLAILENESQKDLLTGAIMALAKIGDEGTGHTPSRLAEVIRPFLAHANQEVAETAAIALGVLAHPGSAPLLTDILHDGSRGRSATDRSKVPLRTRAFAAYGLGLIGYRSHKEDVRRYVVHHLLHALETDASPSRDVPVACIISLGLVRLKASGAPFPTDDAGLPDPSPGASREAQLLALLTYFEEQRNDPHVRSHVPVALARLAVGTHESWRERLMERLAAALDRHSGERPAVQQGACAALGILGDGDGDPADAAIRQTLRDTIAAGDRLVGYLAMVSLARVSARPGAGKDPDLDLADVRQFLLQRMARGKTAERPWAAMALGLLERQRGENGHATSADVRRALTAALGRTGSPLEAGGYCIAAGLSQAQDAEPELLARVSRQDEELIGHASIGLGLLRSRDAIAPLRQVVASSRYRPHVLREAATALGLLGDKQVVPLLIEMLISAESLATQAAIASALGFIGDSRSIDPLVAMLGDERGVTDRARAFAAVALGIVCDKEPLPWNSKLAVDVNYRLPPDTLLSPLSGTGVLDLL